VGCQESVILGQTETYTQDLNGKIGVTAQKTENQNNTPSPDVGVLSCFLSGKAGLKKRKSTNTNTLAFIKDCNFQVPASKEGKKSG
jgi:hypothetical protein